ncbi:hypothetical protein [Streptomyces cinereoruber]|uniref:hypothetical protein n=1 Tax=Streptomyces cinereoruber TaxID=67260 RepID=UPI003629DCBB
MVAGRLAPTDFVQEALGFGGPATTGLAVLSRTEHGHLGAYDLRQLWRVKVFQQQAGARPSVRLHPGRPRSVP